jgi:hypothetical protein
MVDPARLPDRDRDSFENPYAPPDSTFVKDPPRFRSGRIAFDIGDLFHWTWSLYQERFRTCMSIIWGVCGLNVLISFALNAMLEASATAIRDPIFFAIAQIGITFGGYVVQFWLNVGTNIALLKIARGEEVAFEDVFTGGRYVLTTILASLASTVCVAGPMLLAFVGVMILVPTIQQDRSVLSVLLAIFVVGVLGVIAVYLSVRLSQFSYVVIDRNAGVFDSLRISWYLTKNQVPTMILVYLLGFTIIVAGFLAVCVGLIFAIPLASLLLAVTYVALAGQPSAPDSPERDGWDEDAWKDE